MSADRAAQLLADGFERLVTFPVGVPHFVWKVDLEIEFDRDLRLIEETVLRLVQAEVGDPTQMAALMGLTGQPVVATAVVNLLRLGGITQREDRLWLTPFGSQMLERATMREVRSYTDVEVRHDPYRDELRWRFDDDDEELKEGELRPAGLRGLPDPGALSPGELISRYRDIQTILERDGLPAFDNKDDKARKRRRDILRVQPLKHYVAYREAELEVWYRRDRDEWQWRLLRGGGEEHEISAKLVELEAQGTVIIPLDERRESPRSQRGEVVHAAVEAVQTKTKAAVIEGPQHREALREAISDARKELVIVSPWLKTAAVDREFLGWLTTALDKHRELRVTIAYGIDDSGRRPDPTIRDQQDALRNLRKVEQRTKGRLRIVDIGNTHEKVVICDDCYCIITSYNWLSFKQRPGRGIRREIGHRIVDPEMVAQVKASIVGAMAQGAE